MNLSSDTFTMEREKKKKGFNPNCIYWAINLEWMVFLNHYVYWEQNEQLSISLESRRFPVKRQDVLSNYCAISLVNQLVNRLKVRKIMQYEDYVSLIQSFLLLGRHLILVNFEWNSMPLIWYNCNYFQILFLFESICRFFGPHSWKL